MATLNKVKRGQTVTEQVELINENVESINTELIQLHSDVENNVAGYITSAEAPVQSVNSQTGDVTLSANDVGAFPNSSTIQVLDINNTKTTGVYIGTDNDAPVYLLVIKYSDNNIYQELIGSNFKKYRRFTTSWSEWVQDYSNEHPVTASDVTGISNIDGNSNLDLALLNNGTFVKADIKYNPSTKKLYYGNEEFATKTYVDEAVNMIHSIIVTELPITGVENTIYYVPDTTPETNNAYLEYVYVNGAWELLGATEVDLTPFLTKTEASQTYATKQENDGKVSKTTTINGKALSSDITLTASDVGALPSDTPIPADLVHRYSNSTIASMLSGGEFINGDVFIASDDGTYKIGHIYKYNNGLVDITDIPSDYVDLTSDQSIGGTKNFTGLLRYGGVTVATSDDISTTQGMIPTSTSDLTNDGDGTSAFATASDLADVADDIPTSTSELLNDGDGTSAFATEDYVDANGGKIDTIKVNGTTQTITNKEVDISVPTNTNQLTNGAGFITGINSTDVTTALGYTPYNATNPNNYQTQTQVEAMLANKADKSELPTQTSDLTNDSGFITNTVNNLSNYYLKTETYTQAEVNSLIGAITTITYEVVNNLPTASATTYFNESKKVYLVAISDGSGNDYYDEYVTIRSGTEGSYTYSWEKIGNTQVDLTNYVTTNTAQTINAKKTFSTPPVTNNNIAYRSKNSGGTEVELIRIASSNTIILGDSTQLYDLAPYGNLRPISGRTDTLGTSTVPWNKIYGTTIYQNGKQVANAEDIPTVPTNVSSFTNDAGYLTSQSISGKLDKVTTNNTVYGVDGSGNQTNYAVANASNVGNAVAKYDSSGRLKAYTPSANDDVANKKYVDDKVAAVPTPAVYVQSINGESGILTGYAKVQVYNSEADAQAASQADPNKICLF